MKIMIRVLEFYYISSHSEKKSKSIVEVFVNQIKCQKANVVLLDNLESTFNFTSNIHQRDTNKIIHCRNNSYISSHLSLNIYFCQIGNSPTRFHRKYYNTFF